MWAALIAQGDAIHGAGVLSHLRATSVETFGKCYGVWLAWIEDRDPSGLEEDPVLRATPARIHSWTESMAGLSPTTRLIRAGHLLRVLMAHAPDADWRARRRVVSRIRREASDTPKTRRAGRIFSSADLYEAGTGLIASGGGLGRAPASLQQAKRQRDGTMVAFLSLLPLRRRAFCNLDLGGAVLLRDGGIVISLEPERTKTGAPWEAPVPQLLTEPLAHYLTQVRPWLMTRRHARHNSLWVNDAGRGYYEPHLAARIPKITRRLVGVSVPIHLFRDAAVTTLAYHSPDAARLARALLGHSDFRMAARHYNHARMVEAARGYSSLIDELRDVS